MDTSDPLTFTLTIVVLIFSIILHELAHGYAANWLGDPTARLSGRLTLNPISHIEPFGSIILPILSFWGGGFIFGWAKPVPYNPYNLQGKYAETVVAVAGITANFMLAIVFGLIIRFFGFELSPAFIEMASTIVLINLVLGIFNLVPIPPLDGSKILLSLSPIRWHEFSQKMERWGMLVLIVFIVFVWQLFQPVIGWLFSLLTGLQF